MLNSPPLVILLSLINPVQHFIYVKSVLIFSSNLRLSLPKNYLSGPLCELPPLYWNNRCLFLESYETDTVNIYREKIITFCVHYWLLINVDTWIRNIPCSRSTNARYLTCGFFWNTLQDFSAMYYVAFCTKWCALLNKICLNLEAWNAYK